MTTVPDRRPAARRGIPFPAPTTIPLLQLPRPASTLPGPREFLCTPMARGHSHHPPRAERSLGQEQKIGAATRSRCIYEHLTEHAYTVFQAHVLVTPIGGPQHSIGSYPLRRRSPRLFRTPWASPRNWKRTFLPAPVDRVIRKMSRTIRKSNPTLRIAGKSTSFSSNTKFRT